MANASSLRQDGDPDLAVGVDLFVDPLLDLVDQVAGHRLELEIHPSRQRLHVAARDRCAMVAPHDSAQDVQRRMRSHQLVASLPVELGGDLGVDRRKLGAGLDGVPDVVVALLRADDLPGAARVADQDAGIGRLAPATGVEHRPLQEDRVCLVIDFHHRGLGHARVGIGVADVLAHTARLAEVQASRRSGAADTRPVCARAAVRLPTSSFR